MVEKKATETAIDRRMEFIADRALKGTNLSDDWAEMEKLQSMRRCKLYQASSGAEKLPLKFRLRLKVSA